MKSGNDMLPGSPAKDVGNRRLSYIKTSGKRNLRWWPWLCQQGFYLFHLGVRQAHVSSSLSPRYPSSLDAVSHIALSSAQIQVGRSQARRIVASMQNPQMCRNRPGVNFVRQSMRPVGHGDPSPDGMQQSVAVFVAREWPDPTGFGLLGFFHRLQNPKKPLFQTRTLVGAVAVLRAVFAWLSFGSTRSQLKLPPTALTVSYNRGLSLCDVMAGNRTETPLALTDIVGACQERLLTGCAITRNHDDLLCHFSWNGVRQPCQESMAFRLEFPSRTNYSNTSERSTRTGKMTVR